MKRSNLNVTIFALIIVFGCFALQSFMIYRHDIKPFLFFLLMGIQVSAYFIFKPNIQ